MIPSIKVSEKHNQDSKKIPKYQCVYMRSSEYIENKTQNSNDQKMMVLNLEI